MAVETMKGILQQHESFLGGRRPYVPMDMLVLHRIQRDLQFQQQIMKSLQARSKANEERLRNEIAFVSFFAT